VCVGLTALPSGGQYVSASFQSFVGLSLRTCLFIVNAQSFFMLNAASGVNLPQGVAFSLKLGDSGVVRSYL